MSDANNRWATLMTNLESVVDAAMAMRDAGDMTEKDYQRFNGSIWELEEYARHIGDDE